MAPTTNEFLEEAAKLYAVSEDGGISQFSELKLKPSQCGWKKDMRGHNCKEPISQEEPITNDVSVCDSGDQEHNASTCDANKHNATCDDANDDDTHNNDAIDDC